MSTSYQWFQTLIHPALMQRRIFFMTYLIVLVKDTEIIKHKLNHSLFKKES
ncbi:MAG: hypothetical protein HRU34_15465 [Richelia sp.]|nr:hypothetical protein [Richelia sp.]